MLEILAPAGNKECALAAINNGANAIYLGYSAFSARQGAENFAIEELTEIIAHAHFCGVFVYVAMNTIVKDHELEDFLSILNAVWLAGADAVILQDALLGKEIKKQCPEIILHLSTQAGVCTENGAIFAKECGFSRVILARETPLAEIEKITKIIETEVFVQGALCTAFSGQCYFSSFAGGNSGNRGRCKQPCRKCYSYNRNGFEEKSYALSLSDLCVGEDVQKLIDAGVMSFKIEGRMRRGEYVAATVRYYRAIFDNATDKQKNDCLSDLKRTYNRGNYTKGLAFGQDKRFLSTTVQGHIGEKVGVVKVLNGKYFVESVFRPQTGDAFKILRDGKEAGGAVFNKNEGRGFFISSKIRLKNGDGVFITTDTAVKTRLLQVKKYGNIAVSLYFQEGEIPIAKCGDVRACGLTPLQSAKSRALTVDELKECFLKTDGLPVDIAFSEIHLKGNIFIPKSELNAIRRSLYAQVKDDMAGYGRLPFNNKLLKNDVHFTLQANNKIALISNDFTNIKADVAIYKADDLRAPLPAVFLEGEFEKYLYYPAFVTAADEKAIKMKMQEGKIDGIYVENYGGLVFARENNLAVFVGTGLNLINRISIQALLQLPYVRYYALSKETNEKEAQGLLADKAFVLASGNIKLMDLCYCPFGKTCGSCDKKQMYLLTDESGRGFPVRRYVTADGGCRFEVYNCADLVSSGINGAGKLMDVSVLKDKNAAVNACDCIQKQKEVYKNQTSGHYKRGVL